MAEIIQIRRDTSVNWISENPILADGEFAIEKTQGASPKIKIGDGVTDWNSLPYWNSGVSGLSMIKFKVGDFAAPSDGDSSFQFDELKGKTNDDISIFRNGLIAWPTDDYSLDSQNGEILLIGQDKLSSGEIFLIIVI